MKRLLLIPFVFLMLVLNAHAQPYNKTMNRDSLFKEVMKTVPKDMQEEFQKDYIKASPEVRDNILFWLRIPQSSKAELIKNIDENYDKINYLKAEYAKMVPPGYNIRIEFEPEDKFTNTKERIDLCITLIKNKETIVSQDWNLDYNSDKLKGMLDSVKWNNQTLGKIKTLLADAHCIGIENGLPAKIEFARSGFGLYSYDMFDNNLTAMQIKGYNDGCTYIYYKNNIVLEYGGGATGPQCFPDK